MKRKWIGLMLCAALLAGCAGEAGSSGASAEVPGGGIQRMDIRQELEPVKTENAFEKAAYFGDMVYQCQPNQNTLVSPLSLDMALGLAAEGAAGDTAKELADYLGREDYGTFAKEFLLDMSDAGSQVHFNAMRKIAAEHPSETVGKEIRKLYSWSDEDKLINN